MMLHDSFWIDHVWASQFTALLREGVIYPRWLPWSHEGLGSPVFYYYPPLAFYLTGAFGLGATPTNPATLVPTASIGLAPVEISSMYTPGVKYVGMSALSRGRG